MSAYVRSNYKSDLISFFRDVEYGGVSDARILFAAWQYDCVLVTSNIKDFVLYPLLFEPEEDRLYDILNGNYVKIDSTLHEAINSDAGFEALKNELNELIGEE